MAVYLSRWLAVLAPFALASFPAIANDAAAPDAGTGCASLAECTGSTAKNRRVFEYGFASYTDFRNPPAGVFRGFFFRDIAAPGRPSWFLVDAIVLHNGNKKRTYEKKNATDLPFWNWVLVDGKLEKHGKTLTLHVFGERHAPVNKALELYELKNFPTVRVPNQFFLIGGKSCAMPCLRYFAFQLSRARLVAEDVVIELSHDHFKSAEWQSFYSMLFSKDRPVIVTGELVPWQENKKRLRVFGAWALPLHRADTPLHVGSRDLLKLVLWLFNNFTRASPRPGPQ